MTKSFKTVSAAIAVTVIAAGGMFTAPATASAAGMARLAPVESSGPTATQVGFKGHFKHGHYGHYNVYYGGYYPYYPNCFWKKQKIWTPYGWQWQKVKVCY